MREQVRGGEGRGEEEERKGGEGRGEEEERKGGEVEEFCSHESTGAMRGGARLCACDGCASV